MVEQASLSAPPLALYIGPDALAPGPAALRQLSSHPKEKILILRVLRALRGEKLVIRSNS